MSTIWPQFLVFITLTAIVEGFLEPTRTLRARSLLKFADISVFTDSMLRVHDNPCLRETVGEVCAVYVGLDGQAAQAISRRLGSHVWSVSSVNEASAFFSKELPAVSSTESRLLFCDELHPLLAAAAPADIPKVRVEDKLHGPDLGQDVESEMLVNPVFPFMRDQLYSRSALSKLVPKPLMDMTGINFVGGSVDVEQDAEDEELRALTLIRDYVVLGERATTEKYAKEYIESASLSVSHKKSLERLVTNQEKAQKGYDLFSGEVVSGLVAKYQEKGLISPRLMVHPRSPVVADAGMYPLTEMEAITATGGFFQCQLREDAIRQDWQRRVAKYSQAIVDEDSGLSKSGYKESFQQSCGGYLERTGVMQAPSPSPLLELTSPSPSPSPVPPLAVLIHGFGGSMDQMSGMARELQTAGFEVLGVDLIGFGRSEKPPLSYNQYFWRDQVIEAVNRHQSQCGNIHRKVIFLGNSIGGFTAASAAASFADPLTTETSNIMTEGHNLEVAGLVLFNSAGRIISSDGTATASTGSLSVEQEMDSGTELYSNKFYPAYSGPPGALLRVFGSGLIAALQPQIRKTTEWLYPSRPGYIAQSGLDESILRDSLDPGARDVMASGAKLPAPVSINTLFECFKGPVLIAQGALDPLNDAVDRASKFGAIREGVTVSLMDLGHCPMDEDPSQCAKVIKSWLNKEQVLKSSDVARAM